MDDSQELCRVCNQPMLEGQALNGMKRTHWDCSSAMPVENPIRQLKARLGGESKPQSAGEKPARTDGPTRAYEKGPTWDQIAHFEAGVIERKIECRQWQSLGRISENGRTRIQLQCPFCSNVVEAYVWSLGNGKRCTCGAMHGRLGSHHWQEEPCAS